VKPTLAVQRPPARFAQRVRGVSRSASPIPYAPRGRDRDGGGLPQDYRRVPPRGPSRWCCARHRRLRLSMSSEGRPWGSYGASLVPDVAAPPLSVLKCALLPCQRHGHARHGDRQGDGPFRWPGAVQVEAPAAPPSHRIRGSGFSSLIMDDRTAGPARLPTPQRGRSNHGRGNNHDEHRDDTPLAAVGIPARAVNCTVAKRPES
jgi:hypothetical protein